MCGIDGWGYLFNVFDVFTREWVGYCFDLSAVKENAIISVENALVTHKGIVPENFVIRTDNGSQYTSKAFRKSLSVLLGLKLEHIYYNTPEQNGHIESFHKTLKKEYIWPNDFQNYQEAESAIKDAFTDYNQNRIHSALRYLTPYEFISKWKIQQEEKEKKVINIGNENSIHKIMGKVFPKIGVQSSYSHIIVCYHKNNYYNDNKNVFTQTK